MEEQGLENLSRRERRRLMREEEKVKIQGREFLKNTKKYVTILLVVVGLLGAGYWFYRDATKPLPGQTVADLGREHVPEDTKIEYNSNPPTSGSHFEEWTKAGTYDKPIEDGHLVHSLEHGYVIMSYKCEDDCSDLVSKLTSIYEKKGRKKLIVIPRPGLDTKIALTAWSRIDKFNEFDEGRIIRFIDSFRDRGPEKTME